MSLYVIGFKNFFQRDILKSKEAHFLAEIVGNETYTVGIVMGLEQTVLDSLVSLGHKSADKSLE